MSNDQAAVDFSGGGGTVWDAIVYDKDLDQIYLGVGNGNPCNHGTRSNGEGDNWFLSSVVALDATTGRYKWHYQETPAESWDYTATQPLIPSTFTRHQPASHRSNAARARGGTRVLSIPNLPSRSQNCTVRR